MSLAMVSASSSSSSTIFLSSRPPSSRKPSSSCTFAKTTRRLPLPTSIHQHRPPSFNLKCQAARDDAFSEPPTVYQGVYGPWSVDSSDIREVSTSTLLNSSLPYEPFKSPLIVALQVVLYRSGLVTAATSFVLATSAVFLPDDFILTDFLKQNVDGLYAIGGAGLGLSLVLIHIYVTEIKRGLQALWVLGVVGSVAAKICLAQPADESLVQYVVDHPVAVWFVGPLFAALTGLVFKEGLCYGKLEAGLLTFVIPSVLLGHLSGLMDDGVKVGLLGAWMALFVVFAARKFTQPIKDDIGDKSVFTFNALPEEEKRALMQKLEQEKI